MPKEKLEIKSVRPIVRRVAKVIGAVAANLNPNSPYDHTSVYGRRREAMFKRREKRILDRYLERKDSDPNRRSLGRRAVRLVTELTPLKLAHLSNMLPSKNPEQRRRK